MVGPYSKSIRQQHPGGAIIQNNANLTCMMMIDLVTGWFKIVEIPMFNLNELTAGNDEYIYKSSESVRHIFNNIGICRYRVHVESCVTTDLGLTETSLIY